MGIVTLFSRLNNFWQNEKAIDPDPKIASEWMGALKGVTDDEVWEALPSLVQRMERRPVIADLIAAAKNVRAAQPAPLALPEPRAGIPDNVTAMVDAILQRQHKQRETLPELRVIGHDYRPSKPLHVERTLPLDSLQRWLSRHYAKDMTLTCAGCGGRLHEGDWYTVDVSDNLIHTACEGHAAASA
jgi:hypothetical protein